jgi:hypothetical protein
MFSQVFEADSPTDRQLKHPGSQTASAETIETQNARPAIMRFSRNPIKPDCYRGQFSLRQRFGVSDFKPATCRKLSTQV